MEVIVNMTCYLTLDEEDTKKLEDGKMDLEDINWNYYAGKYTDMDVIWADIR